MAAFLALIASVVTIAILLAFVRIQDQIIRDLNKALEISQRTASRYQAEAIVSRSEILATQVEAKIINLWRARNETVA